MKYNLFVEWSCLFGAAWLVADEILMNHQSLDVFWLYIKQHAAEGQNKRENNWEIRGKNCTFDRMNATWASKKSVAFKGNTLNIEYPPRWKTTSDIYV